MELVLPFILVVIGWNPDSPGETMALQHSLHVSEQACEDKGLAFMEEHKDLAAGAFPAQYRYFCLPTPSVDEYEDLFEIGQ